MILFGVDGMAAANKPNSDQYLDNYEKIFKKEEFDKAGFLKLILVFY